MHHLVGKTIGGHEILSVLGAGGMGAVFKARQISLDREVALKVLPERFAQNAEAMARFTREALSAAQLSHHNVVQVYDVGEDQGVHYISMEFVRGKSLADLIRKDGRLTIDDAAGYVLQAARGLKVAHDQGIIHRDIKPDNLLLSEHGVVKIADMGLAKSLKGFEPVDGDAPTELELKSLGADLTLANRGMGTPAYMPPEQARDAAHVDQRADQYSLGCTLYYLCAGKAPYSGTTAFELITKHMKEPLTPLDVHVRNVPGPFKAIIERMLEKNPEDRYAGMAEVIRELERYLDVDSEKGPYTPREQHVAALEGALEEFYQVPSAGLRSLATMGLFGLCGLLFVYNLLIAKDFQLAGGFAGLAVLTPVFNFLIQGLRTKNHLFRRVRAVFFGMPLLRWLQLGLAAAGLVAVLYVLGWLFSWIAFAVVALGLAVGFEFAVLKPLRTQRAGPLDRFQKTLRELRLRGVGEEALQEFVCRFAGTNWEEFHEALFGYEAMIRARIRVAALDQSKPRKKFATWRDALARWLDDVELKRKEARERRALMRAEAQRLRAQGKSEQEAEMQAQAEAEKFMAAEQKKAEAAEKRRVKEMTAAEVHAHLEERRPFSRSGVNRLFTLARLVAGLVVTLLAALMLYGQGLTGNLPGPVRPYLNAYYAWGQGRTIYALAAGVLLLVTVFSSRMLGPALTTLGAALIVGNRAITELAGQPTFTPQIAWLAGCALAAGGVILCVLGKIGKGRF